MPQQAVSAEYLCAGCGKPVTDLRTADVLLCSHPARHLGQHPQASLVHLDCEENWPTCFAYDFPVREIVEPQIPGTGVHWMSHVALKAWFSTGQKKFLDALAVRYRGEP